MPVNLKKEEVEVLEEILDSPEFWCECDDGKKSCGECSTYLNWSRIVNSIKEKVSDCSDRHGHRCPPSEHNALIAKWRAERYLERMRSREVKVSP